MTDSENLVAARDECLATILACDSPRQLIVAGAGTGKTFTFKQLLKKESGNSLAITFLNALANDMAEELCDLADTRTFHSFCRTLLHRISSDGITANFHFFPKLERLIVADALALGFNDKVGSYFGDAFRTLVEDDGRIEFFLNRASFYNAVGFDDSVYRVLQNFRGNSVAIPEFDQIVVDEYQDFNRLEVEFIDHLETKSPIMIVGDDDQAIYDFKAASSEYLRKKAVDSTFEKHDLPYCSRCTTIVVEACNGFIEEAVKQGMLKGRIDKQYSCYSPDKEADNERYPNLIHASCSVNTKKAPYIAKYIERIIRSVPGDEIGVSVEGRYPLALIIGPSHYLQQIHNYLASCLPNVIYKRREKDDLTFLDGYRILLKNEESNLGWRIVTWVEDPTISDEYIDAAAKQGTPLVAQVESENRTKHRTFLELLRALIAGQEIGRDGTAALEAYLGLPIEKVVEELGLNVEDEADRAEESAKTANNHPEIWLTTYNGCKGMSAAFTFIVGLENSVLPRDAENVTDNEVCQLIVALTRTRKQCHLISTGRFGATQCKSSIFVKWIPDGCMSQIRVDKDYF